MRFGLGGMIASDEDAPIWRWFGFQAVSPADIRNALAQNPAGEEFVLEFNSGGGSVYAGFEMYSVLRAATVPTRGEVQSLAGSAASVVLVGCDTAAASPVGQVMIHLPSTLTEGNQIAHRQSTQMLDAVTNSIIAAYESKCRGKTSRDALRRMMDRETFLTAQEALDTGLIDEIMGADEGTPAPAMSAANVMNAAGGLPDIEKLRAAYREAQGQPPPVSNLDKVNCPEGAKEDPLEDKDKANARARAIALAEAQTHLTTIRYK